MKYFKKITFLASCLSSSNVWAQIGWGNVWRINVRFDLEKMSPLLYFCHIPADGLHKVHIQVNLSFCRMQKPQK